MVEEMLVWFGRDDQIFPEVLYPKLQVLDHMTMKVVFTSVCACEEGCLGEMRFLCISLH